MYCKDQCCLKITNNFILMIELPSLICQVCIIIVTDFLLWCLWKNVRKSIRQFEITWTENINRGNSRTDNGRNKFRTFVLFKENYCTKNKEKEQLPFKLSKTCYCTLYMHCVHMFARVCGCVWVLMYVFLRVCVSVCFVLCYLSE